MAELLKQQVSLTVLRVRVVDAATSFTADVSGASTLAPAVTATPRVMCELQITGKTEERGFASPAGESNLSSSRRGRRANLATVDDSEAALRTVAQWNFAAQEVQLPVEFTDATRFRDKATRSGEFMADITRAFATKVFSEFRVDTFERLASTKSWLPSGKPTLPSAMTRQLVTLLPLLMHEGDCLWLEFAEPAGYLPLLPWEEMLRPATAVPILRLSPHAVKAVSPDRELSVVLCVTVPSKEWLPTVDHLASLARAIRLSLPERSSLHVFADDLCHAPFAAANEKVGSDDDQGRRIKLYPLPGPQPRSAPEKEKLPEQPWMAWLVASLAGRAVDIVHCLSPGMLLPDHARLVIARDATPYQPPSSSPLATEAVTGRALNYVTPLEHSDLLTSLGAWASIFSAPGTGPWVVESRKGLRTFVDQFARVRPGVAAFHDLETDPACEALAQTYRFIIGDPSIPAATSSSVSVYCHPARATPVAALPSSEHNDLMSQFAKVEQAMQSVAAASGPLPAWLAATQRIVEQAVARVADPKELDSPAARGVASALKYVEQMLVERVQPFTSQKTESASGLEEKRP